ncbi:MAG: hypothetical protein MJK04_03375 [Psychrosphaera sp.]|nr:hypothetical protein [Psychrosphaera sp.]
MRNNALYVFLLLFCSTTFAHEQPPKIECPPDVIAFNLPTECTTGMSPAVLQTYGTNKMRLDSRYGEMLASVIEFYQVDLSFDHFAPKGTVELDNIEHAMRYYLEQCDGESYQGPLPVDQNKAHKEWIKQYKGSDICVGLRELRYQIGSDYYPFILTSEKALILQFTMLANGRAKALFKYSNDFGRLFVGWGTRLIKPCLKAP